MIRAIVPAAGKGTRSGLCIPKTLQLIDGKPILVRILHSLRDIDPEPAVIVSPSGRKPICDAIARYPLRAEIIDQPEPRGMGDAILQFMRSPSFEATDDVVVIWGDMMSIPAALIGRVVRQFWLDKADFAFPTCFQNPCYTYVERDPEGRIRALLERREHGDVLPNAGESDCGLFVFRRDPIFRILTARAAELIGRSTGEFGFLDVVGLLTGEGCAVRAYAIASEVNAVSFNSPIDLVNYQELRSRSTVTQPGSQSRNESDNL